MAEQVRTIDLDRDSVTAVPAHVPPGQVVDLDIYSPPGGDADFHVAWRAVQQAYPSGLIWTPRNGGHWVLLDGRAYHAVLGDPQRFPTRVVILPATRGKDYKVLPTTLSPPVHGSYRALINHGLSPKSVFKLEPKIRALVVELIESFQAKGSCEFIEDYAMKLPLRLFMTLVDLPAQDIPRLKALADQVTRPDGTMAMADVIGALQEYLRPYLQARRQSPGDDMLSYVANGQIDGAKIAFDDAMDLCVQLLIGGMDTVASFLGFVMDYLAKQPCQRQRLIDDPEKIPAAVDEFFRRYPIVILTRTAAEDLELLGMQIKAGDHIALPTPLHGLDEAAYDHAMDVEFDRDVGAHSTFGHGTHRCPGAFLARTEVRLTVEEWLKRIPDFAIDPKRPVVKKAGLVGSVQALPLVWG